jgi:hypothetical protein
MNRLDLPLLHGTSLDTRDTLYLDEARVLDTLVHNLEGMAYRCLEDAHWTMLFVTPCETSPAAP